VYLVNWHRNSKSILATAAMLSVALFGGNALQAKPSKLERQQAQLAEQKAKLERNLTSGDPHEYCAAAMTLEQKGFFPYCSPLAFPMAYGHAFSANHAIYTLDSRTRREVWRTVGDRKIHPDATDREYDFIKEVIQARPTNSEAGCLGQSASNCIAYLSSRFLVTTRMDYPFFDNRRRASFDTDKPDSKSLDLHILLPHTDKGAYPKTEWYSNLPASYKEAFPKIDGLGDRYGNEDRSKIFDTVKLYIYLENNQVKSVEIDGRFPILSENPNDYEGSGFAAFLQGLFPTCPTDVADVDFYKSFWTALVKTQRLGEGSGKWRTDGDGVSQYTAFQGRGEFCKLKADALRMSGTSYRGESGRRTFSGRSITFRQ
jgi:hypothetical protein